MPFSGSPDAGKQAPAYPPRITGITIQLVPQHAFLLEHAVKQEWQHHGSKECSGQPRAERNPAGKHDHYYGTVSGMPNESIWAGRDHVLAAVGLDAHYRGKEPVHEHCPQSQPVPCSKHREREALQPGWHVIGPMEIAAIQSRDDPMNEQNNVEQPQTERSWFSTGSHPLLQEPVI